MGRPGLTRRQLLATAGGLTIAGSFGFAALGTGADALAPGARTRVRYWNLFQGGDGTNQVAMVDAFRKGHPDIAVKEELPFPAAPDREPHSHRAGSPPARPHPYGSETPRSPLLAQARYDSVLGQLFQRL